MIFSLCVATTTMTFGALFVLKYGFGRAEIDWRAPLREYKSRKGSSAIQYSMYMRICSSSSVQ